MTLSEIETTLGELAARHPDLNEKMLNTLLLSAGWEERKLKEALMLFKQNTFTQKGSLPETKTATPTLTQPSIFVPPLIADIAAPEKNSSSATEAVVLSPEVVQEEAVITFYHPDGSEEGDLNNVAEIPLPVVETKVVTEKFTQISEMPAGHDDEHKEEVTILTPGQDVVRDIQDYEHTLVDDFTGPRETSSAEVVVASTAQASQLSVTPSVSVQRLQQKEQEIPANLPLLPFESSPHVWSFSRYKDVFHGEVMADPVTVHSTETKTETALVQPVAETEVPLVPLEEVIVEKVPMDKQDESLVVLAAFMLLVIILILGYMYSNGRL